MAENARKRVSKWDVIAEASVSFETELEYPFLGKVDNIYKETQTQSNLSSSTADHEKSSLPPGLIVDPLLEKVDDSYKETQKQTNLSTSIADCENNSLPQDSLCEDSLGKGHSKMPDYRMKDENIIPSNGFSDRMHSPNRSDRYHSPHIYSESSKNEAAGKDAQVKRLLDRNLDSSHDSRSHEIPSRGWSSRNRSNSRSRSGSRSLSRGRSRSRSRGRGRGRGSSRSRSRSRKSRSRSWNRGRNRSRSWSRGRSRSPKGARHRPDKWVDRQRAGPGQAPACRDFAVGRCRRGNQCRFLHDDRSLQDYDRHHNKHSRESRYEGERYQGYGYKEKLATPGNHSEFSQRPLRRHGIHNGDDDLKNFEIHRNSKPPEICYDFIKGRCRRGTNCRYLHHEASSGRWSKDESRGQINDGGDNALHTSELRMVSDAPCMYFAQGRCRLGESCRFSHEETPFAFRPQDDPRSYNEGINDVSTGNDLNQGGQSDLISSVPQLFGGNELAASLPIGGKSDYSIQVPQCQHEQADKTECQNLSQGELRKISSSQVPNTSQEVPLQNSFSSTTPSVQPIHGNSLKSLHGAGPVIFSSSGNQSEMNSAGVTLSTNQVPAQGFAQNCQNQFPVSHPLHGQIPVPNIQIPQASPVPYSGQIPQMIFPMPPAGQNMFINPLASSNLQHFNPNLPSLPFHPAGSIGPNLQNSTVGLQIQQKAPFPPNEQGQQNFNVNVYNPLGQNQFNVNLSSQNSQNIIPCGQNQNNLNISQSGHSLQSAQSQVEDGQNQHVLSNASMDLHGLKLDVNLKSTELAAGEGSQNKFNMFVAKPTSTTSTSDAIISAKVVTSEQAAKITNLSASLAQFFGSAALHASASVFPPSQSLVNPSSVVLPVPMVAPSITHGPVPDALLPVADPRKKELQAESKSSNPLIDNDTTNDFKHENVANKQDSCFPTTKGNGTEIGGKINKEEELHSDDDEDEQADDDAKRSKDVKAVKMFKCTLVDFVKDILKPIWKEGQLSKEAHKIIVKKVVNKVSGAMSASNIPSTQEKIDSYLIHSKAKLAKLVQAYVEKYVKG